MKILFYVEPHIIRGSALDFKWIARHFVNISLSLNRQKTISAKVFSNNNIVSSIRKDTKKKFSFHFSFPEEWRKQFDEFSSYTWNEDDISKWVEVLNGKGPFSEFYLQNLELIHTKFDFDVLIYWGNSTICSNFCKKYNKYYISMEQGPIRLPFKNTVIADYVGVNGDSTSSNKDLIENFFRDTPFSEIDTDIFNNEELRLVASSVPKIEELSQSGKYIVIALQLPDDTNALQYSRFQSLEEYVDFAMDECKNFKGVVVIKLHPGYRNNQYNLEKTEFLIEYVENNYPNNIIIKRGLSSSEQLSFLWNSSGVIVNNSSIGFESAILGIPVSTLSPHHYGGSKFFPSVREVNNWSPIKQENYDKNIGKILTYMVKNNLYQREFALSDVGIVKIINDQTSRFICGANNVEKYKDINYLFSVIENNNTSVGKLIPTQPKDGSTIIKKIRTAKNLFKTNKVLFFYEIKKRMLYEK